jgi:hypothetical protein
MTPEQFINKWSRADRTERQAAQEHFIDLCRVLGEATPNEAHDPDTYSFEKGVSKTDGSSGFADVWKRGCFGWEYKKDRANLDRAYQQLQLYSVALENPPLLVVSDTKRFRIYTNWTNTVQEKHEFTLEDLAHTKTRELLKNVFHNPDKLKPAKTREQVTKEAAKEFTTISALGTALVAAGVFAPVAALMYGLSRPEPPGFPLSVVTVACFAAGVSLHVLGRLTLGRLRQ